VYCNADDLTSLIPQWRILELADDSADASGSWSNAAVQEVLRAECEGASREIDSMIGNRYAVPLNPVPAVVADWAKRLTVARLFLRRPDLEGEAPGRWRKEQERITRLLEKTGAGQVSLGAPEKDQQTAPDDGSIGISTTKPLFGREMWRRF
jgi:phage gp36-like protein